MKQWIAILMLAAVALSGCADTGSSDEDPQSGGSDDGQGDGHDDGAGNETDEDPSPEANVTALEVDFTAVPLDGTAPLDVVFSVVVSNGTLWVLDFGDGDSLAGNDTSDAINHTYSEGGYVAMLNATLGEQNQVVSINITATPGEGGEEVPPPAVTHWEFGPTAGCMEDLASTCQGLEGGPGTEAPDGHWIPLGISYWGLELTSTVDKGDVAGTNEWPFLDSDCVFTDDAGEVVGEGNNGEGPCATGAIPNGATWLFVYPYLTPAAGMTVDVL